MNLRGVIRPILEVALVLRRLYWRVTRPVTRGVRAVVVRPSDRAILLLKHNYGKGWYLPGGKQRRSETSEKALLRELAEETGVSSYRIERKLGEYLNEAEFKRDTIAVFVVSAEEAPSGLHFEVGEMRFVDPSALPDGTSPGTRRRVEEWMGMRTPDGQW